MRAHANTGDVSWKIMLLLLLIVGVVRAKMDSGSFVGVFVIGGVVAESPPPTREALLHSTAADGHFW